MTIDMSDFGSTSQIFIPDNLFSKVTDIPTDDSEVKVAVLEYVGVDPFGLSTKKDNLVETNVLKIIFMDSKSNVIKLKNLEKPIEFQIPFRSEANTGRNPDFLKCMWYDKEYIRKVIHFEDEEVDILTLELTEEEMLLQYEFEPTEEIPSKMINITTNWTEEFNEPDYSEEGCATVEIQEFSLVCRCSHTTDFAGVFVKTPNMKGGMLQSGIYTIFNPMELWRTTLGFYVTAPIIVFFVLFWFCCCICEGPAINRKWQEILERRMDMTNAA